jgi:hypothetical protein
MRAVAMLAGLDPACLLSLPVPARERRPSPSCIGHRDGERLFASPP